MAACTLPAQPPTNAPAQSTAAAAPAQPSQVVPTRQPLEQTPVPTAALVTPGEGQPIQSGSSPAPFALEWTGQPDPQNLPNECGEIQIPVVTPKLLLSACGGQAKEMSFDNNQAWLEMQNHLTAFEYRSGTDALVFRGRGANGGPAWQRAVLRWVHGRYMELSSGRASAAGSTAVSWFFGEVPGKPGFCKHLTVLNFGYATVEVVPCSGGGPSSNVKQGWLPTPELEAFEAWYNQGNGLYQDNNYFGGAGNRAFTPIEAQAIAAWAEQVYNKIASQQP